MKRLFLFDLQKSYMSLLLSHDVELESVGGEPLFPIRSCSGHVK